MINLSGYRVTQQIYESDHTLVYRGIQENQQISVILKLPRNDYPSFNELVRFRNQYTIAKTLNLPGIVKPLALERYRNGYVLVMEDCGGVSLLEYSGSHPLNIPQFLQLAIAITQILDGLYQQGVIHKDIKPANIIINPQTLEIKLIDFSISSRLPKENPELLHPHLLQGTLSYISPEQTGRMNRGIDYRTDFYSLGVSFYELLVGQLPFPSLDPMELIHAHLAKIPAFPHHIKPDIPVSLSQIVMKLMAKNPEDRYQSAYGLRHDLQLCLQQWENINPVIYFDLGGRDISDRFVIPEKLYGREADVKTLLAAFERVATGSREMMVVAGFSGIGKTALVNEVHKPIVRQNGYFIQGKFDQFQQNRPFSALIQALRDLMGQLLSESAAQVEAWKRQILDALGEQGQVIIDVIPELERLMGQQPSVTELTPDAAQNRFRLLFKQFIQVFTTQAHPLVIFIDDLQWADSASLNFIQRLISETDTGYLLLIGAYRDNEVNDAHPLILTLEEIHKTSAKLSQITLTPLSRQALNHLIADTLNCSLFQAAPLTELVYQKTQGNPFFSIQFLKALHADGWITFNAPNGYWQCDIAQIKGLALTDDVVEFMALQLQKLPLPTQDILKLAACIGNPFDLATLALISEQSLNETAAHLWSALEAGLVSPTHEFYKFYQHEGVGDDEIPITAETESTTVTYKFLHDRVQQAAYSLIPLDLKQKTHVHIGRLLLQNTDKDDNIFEIVNQLNYGIDLINQPAEREQLAQLNLIAGQKAKAATAYVTALNYFQVGLKLITNDSWHCQYDLTLALYNQATEAAYLSGELELMQQFAAVVLPQAQTLGDKVKVYQVQIQAGIAQNKFSEAIQTALSVLQQVGIEFPETPSQSDIERALSETQSKLAGKNPLDLTELPLMTDSYTQIAMRILSSVIPATFKALPELFPLIVLKQVNLSLDYGNAPLSAFTYACYGLLLCGDIGDIELGYQFGEVALQLLNRLTIKELKANILEVVTTYIKPWKEPLKETLNPLLDAYKSGLETGNLEFAAYSLFVYSYYAYFNGKELNSLAKKMATYSIQMQQLKQGAALSLHQPYQQAVLNLIGQTEYPWRLIGEVYNEDTQLSLLRQANNREAICYVYLNKMILCYLFGKYEQAVDYANLAERDLAGGLPVAIFHFYDSLARLARYDEASRAEQETILEKVNANQDKMRNWAVHAPMNFLHKFELVEAERHRVFGNLTEAIDSYEQAIAGAKTSEYIQEEALANERAAQFYVAWGKPKIAQVYLIDAYYGYVHWGAKAKVEALQAHYPQLLTKLSASRDLKTPTTTKSLTTTTSSITGNKETLDLATISKASQAISSEIVLEKLLKTLMEILLENAGAQLGYLILEHQGQFFIEAAGQVDATVMSERMQEDRRQRPEGRRQKAQTKEPIYKEEGNNNGLDEQEINQGEASNKGIHVTVLQSVPIENHLPTSVVNYVARTQENVVLNNATRQGNFTHDTYIKTHQVQSILCAPLLNQGQLNGIIYLENNLTPGAFPPERLELIQLLSGQAAIAITNAKLYAEVRERESQLTQFLEAMPVGVFIADGKGQPYYANQAAQQILGQGLVSNVTAEQLGEVYQAYRRGSEQPYPPERLPIVQALKGKRTTTDDMEIHHPQRVIPIEAWATPIYDTDNHIVYAIVAFQDITARKQAETLLAEYNRTLETQVSQRTQELSQALENLKATQKQLIESEKMAALGGLVAGVAHEINTPLGNGITAASTLAHETQLFVSAFEQGKLKKSALTAYLDIAAESSDLILSNLQRAGELIKSFKQVAVDQTNLEKRCFKLKIYLDEVLLSLKPKLKRTPHQVTVQGGEDISLESYPGALSQVVTNLVLNSILHGYKNTEAGHLQFDITLSCDRVIIQYSDDGCGIPPEHLNKIFEPFFTTARDRGGSGLGLHIVYNLVTQTLKGTIHCDSQVGYGTTFTLGLPLCV